METVDTLKIALIVTFIALVVAGVGAGFVASKNLGSSTLTLSATALLGTALVFFLQVYFELQRSSDIDHVSTNFTVDASGRSIRQWEYPFSSRLPAEVNASNWLKENNPAAFDADHDKLFSDFTILSFVSFLMTTEFDWQLRRLEYPAGKFGTSTTIQPISKDKECTIYHQEDVRAKLKAAGNLFADIPRIEGTNRLCLPPQTTLEILPRAIAFKNYFCEAIWRLDEMPTMISHMTPGSQKADVPTIETGKPRFETRVSGLSAEITYFALRAKSPNMPKYKAWVTRLMTDSHVWFENK